MCRPLLPLLLSPTQGTSPSLPPFALASSIFVVAVMIISAVGKSQHWVGYIGYQVHTAVRHSSSSTSTSSLGHCAGDMTTILVINCSQKSYYYYYYCYYYWSERGGTLHGLSTPIRNTIYYILSAARYTIYFEVCISHMIFIWNRNSISGHLRAYYLVHLRCWGRIWLGYYSCSPFTV